MEFTSDGTDNRERNFEAILMLGGGLAAWGNGSIRNLR